MRKTFSLPVAATAAGGGVTPPPADTVDNIEHSVRFNPADTTYLSRTPSSAGNRKTWTWSGWVKRSGLGEQHIFESRKSSTNSSGTVAFIKFNSTDQFEVVGFGFGWYLRSSGVYRDPCAWYHIVVAIDTGNSTADERVKAWINGQEVTGTRLNPPLDQITGINSTELHMIGGRAYHNDRIVDGYLANVHFVDGQALTPSSFGFTDSNGVWQPKAFTGSYGTNGFHLDFADTSSATALGNDVSGNNNDWTPSGLVAGPAYTANSWSTEFDGTGDYLSIPDSTDFDFGSGDFTIEAWVYPDSGFTLGSIITKRNSSAIFAPFLLRNSSTTSLQLLMSTSGTSWNFNQTAASALTTAAWQHVAVTRSGTAIKAFVNGTEVISSTLSGALTTNTQPVVIGSDVTANHWDGKISNLRIIKGLALYTAAFTPPSTALTAVTDTVLLTCQDSTFIDNSPSAHTITANGDAATTTVSPFEPVDGSDAMLDSPTNYGSGDLVRGNYCTLNPLFADTYGSAVNGNVEYLNTGGAGGAIASTMAVSSGKWYYETSPTNNAYGSGNPVYPCGFLDLDIFTEFTDDIWYTAGTGFYGYYVRDGRKIVNGTISSFATSSTVNDIIGFALDLDAGELEVYKNGTSLGVAATGLTGNYMPCVTSSSNNQTATVNFGQQPFKYPVAGYKAWCSTNLPTPAIADGSTAMDVALYTGTSSGAVVSTPNMSPDLVWIKDRGNTFNHQLFDTIRGANSALLPNLTSAENNYNSFTSFDSTGFTVPNVNGSGADGNNHVAWTWDAGSSTVSNTDGAITSQVRANPTAGVSVVTWTSASSSTTNSFGHGLAKTPEFIVMKSRNNIGNNNNWLTYHSALGATKYLRLNTTDAATTTNIWVSGPSSSVVNIEAGAWQPGDWITYAFAPVEGFSSFGSYTGNGSADGPFVYTGFRPRTIIYKRTDSTGNWSIWDSARTPYNGANARLFADLSLAEDAFYNPDYLSNGFKLRSTNSAANASGGTYVYAAFAEHPFKTSRAR